MPEIPGVPAMPRPTMETTATSSSAVMLSMAPAAISREKARRRASWSSSESPAETTKEMVCSEEAWEIITTLTPLASAASNTRRATPRTPAMPRPSTVTRVIPRIELTVLTPWARVGELSATRVPGCSG